MHNSENRLSRKIYSVSELTSDIKRILEQKYPIIWISGEITNFRVPNSGHAYFSLKDDKAQISAVMFRGQRRQLKFELDDGMAILGLGRISVYEPRGAYQMILEYAEPQGVGALQIAFEQLKNKLAAEGLFDTDHKLPSPFLPCKIGVVTSPSGAVIRDILHVLDRRFSNMAVDIFPVRVQGVGAAEEIIRAVALANKRDDIDVLIIARGGGSLEDLAAYNNESVARAIFASRIAIVSAVGHETDYTIADFVSDVRAPTPSAAAEIVVPVKHELQARCAELRQRSYRALLRKIENQRRHTTQLRRAMIHPNKKIQDLQLRTDDLFQRLFRATRLYMDRIQMRLSHIHKMILANNQVSYVSKQKAMVEVLRYKLLQSINKLIVEKKEELNTVSAVLQAVNPIAILKRGYSITRTLPSRQLVTDALTVEQGQLLEIQLAKGTLDVTVTRKNEQSPTKQGQGLEDAENFI